MDTKELIRQLTEERNRIDAAIKLLSGFSTNTTSAKAPKATRKRKKMSAEARKRIGDAQRKRWAKQKKGA
jgi:predicted ATP-grasp superfamily ATP-dependent carboligase